MMIRTQKSNKNNTNSLKHKKLIVIKNKMHFYLLREKLK